MTKFETNIQPYNENKNVQPKDLTKNILQKITISQ